MGQAAELLIGITLLVVVAVATAFALRRRARSRERLWRSEEDLPVLREQPGLAAWLIRAGYRGPTAPSRFIVACCVSFCMGLGLALILDQSSFFFSAAQSFASLPVVGIPLATLVSWLPWLGAVSLAAMPFLVVRARRDRRVAAVEQDLPLLLELLATLAESGLGFDASLDRVVESESGERPLLQELRIYQAEILGGGSRVECLRRLVDRTEVPSLTSAVSALVQADETGSGLSEVLRPLAEDLRLRRRERALARAEALPEKLVFPLVLGFLPALLVWTLGPSFHQLFGMVDAITRGGP